MRRIEVVTFDLDNTLWDVDHVIRNAERVTRTWFDVHVPELNATLTTDDYAALRQRIVVERPDLAHNLSRLRQEVFTRAILSVGRSGVREGRVKGSLCDRTPDGDSAIRAYTQRGGCRRVTVCQQQRITRTPAGRSRAAEAFCGYGSFR